MTVSVSLRVGVIALLGMMALPFMASANTDCSFTRTLDQGVEGEDVRCLQQFLNSNGYIIATAGGGAPGNETTQFGGLTEAAVIRWQEAKGVSPASGVFGPQSQAMYLQDLASELQVALGITTAQPLANVNVTPQVAGAADSSVAAIFVAALELIEEADDEVEHLVITDQSYKDELRNLNKAKREFMSAAMSYFTGDEAGARVALAEVTEFGEAVIDGTTPRVAVRSNNDDEDEDQEDEDDRDNDRADADVEDDVWDAIDEEWDDYSDVKELIEDEDADDEDTIQAYNQIKIASKVLLEAEEAAEDDDYDMAFDLVEEADAIVDQARDLVS